MRIGWVPPPIRPRLSPPQCLLLRIAAQEPLQVLHIPTELGVQLPGEHHSGRLAQLRRRGGVSLLSDAIREIVGLQKGDPKRNVVMTRAARYRPVDGLRGVEEVLSDSHKRQEKTHEYIVLHQAGRQRLNGAQAEQLVRYLLKLKAGSQRRQRQNILVEGLIEQVKDPSGIAVIPRLVNKLNTEVENNLSRSEQLSLAAAVVASPDPERIRRLPLAERAGEQTLRQIESGASLPGPSVKRGCGVAACGRGLRRIRLDPDAVHRESSPAS